MTYKKILQELSESCPHTTLHNIGQSNFQLVESYKKCPLLPLCENTGKSQSSKVKIYTNPDTMQNT